MNIPCDIHIHTTFSDGHSTPQEVVSLVQAKGLGVLAITDHDTVGGVALGMDAAKERGVICLPGIEISTYQDQEVHILGYNVPYQNQAFLAEIADLQRLRIERIQKVVTKLRNHGVKLVVDDELNVPSVGRSHVAELLVKQGFVRTKAEAFDKYLGKGAPCFVDGYRLHPQDGVALLVRYGAVPVLAHPFRILQSGTLDKLLDRLVAAGLAGVEVYYPNYNQAVRDRLKGMAKTRGLIATGGSDFHSSDWGAAIGEAEAFLDEEAAKRLLPTI